MNRWFPTPEQEEQDIRQENQIEAYEKETAGRWLKEPYMGVFMKWLKTKRRESDPQPGVHADMIYQTGLRDGFQKVRDYIEDLEEKIHG